MSIFVMLAIIGLIICVGVAIVISSNRQNEWDDIADESAPRDRYSYDTETGLYPGAVPVSDADKALFPGEWDTTQAERGWLVGQERGVIDSTEIVWPFDKRHVRAVFGVSERIVDSWIAHHPEVVLEDGRIDVILLIGARYYQLYPNEEGTEA